MAHDQPTRSSASDGNAASDPSSLKGLTMAIGVEPADPDHDPLLGRDIGGVRIVRLIAQGGMGRVYEGKQEKPNRTVAVKVMRPGLTSPSILKRFEYEAEVLGRLQHPGIAHIYSVGVHRMGNASVPYFIMEYIADARTLTKYADEMKLPTWQRLDLFRSVCDAVAHGHQKGVIHRDLKPSNILVDASGQPKVIDFGVARATDSDMALTTMLTDAGQLIGTLQYMSPEQFKADPNDIDVRSDVYALGVILYEFLAGKMPYDVKKKAIHEVARIVQEDDPAPLSSFNRALKGDVAVIAGKCLEKDRARRYSSASELGSDIARFLTGDPILASPPGFFDGLARLAKKHRAAALAVVVVFATLVSAVVGIAAFAAHARQQQVAAERALAFISDMLRASNPRSQKRPTSLIDVLRDARQRLHDDGGLDDRAKATTLLVLARSLLGLGLTEDARSASESALALLESLSGPDSKESLDALCVLLECELSRVEPAAAVQLGERLLAARQARFGATHPDTLEAMANLAVACSQANRLDDAIALSRKTAELQEKSHGAVHRETLLARNNLAVSLRRAGWKDEATVIYRDVVARATESLGFNDPDTLQFLYNLGCALCADGALDESASALRSAYEARVATLGNEHPETLEGLAALAKVLIKMQLPQQAREIVAPSLPRLRRAQSSGDFTDASLREVAAYLFPDLDTDDRLTAAFTYLQAKNFNDAIDALVQAASAAQSDQHATRRLQRWRYLAQYAMEYPKYRDKALASVAAGAEFDVGGRRISVIEFTPREFRYRDSKQPGVNLRVPSNALPPDVEAVIVDQWLAAEERGVEDLVRGAGALVRPKPDAATARNAWTAAVARGEQHGSLLLTILEDPVIRRFVANGKSTPLARPDPGLDSSALQKLDQRMTLVFAKDTLARSIQNISEEIGVPMEILGADLQLEGITKNQSFGLKAHDRTAKEILLEILAKANPDGKLVYIVHNEAGQESIVVTTRAAAAKRKDSLPPGQ